MSPPIQRYAKLLNHVAQTISPSLLEYHSDYEWCQSHSESMLRKLPLLVQLITETFILLVIIFFL